MQDTFEVLHACIVHLFYGTSARSVFYVLLYPTQTHKCDSPFAIVLALINSFVSRLNSLQDIRLLNQKRGGSDWVPHYEKSGQTVFFEKLIWRKQPKRVFT